MRPRGSQTRFEQSPQNHTMENQHPTHSSDTDEILSVLADRDRRTVLNYLRESPTATVSLDELTRAVDERGLDGATEPRIVLHHSTLPKLEAVGVVDYDADRRVVRYLGHELLETLLEEIRNAGLREY